MLLAGGSYDFHFSLATVIYEFRKDVVTCLLIGGALWLIDSRREARVRGRPRQRRRPTPRAVPHMVWLRDGISRIRIEPRDILWISSAGNYVEYSLADGTTHLVRGTLAGEEARLAKFNIVRVHRTRLVNLSRVTGAEGGREWRFRADARHRSGRSRAAAVTAARIASIETAHRRSRPNRRAD